jgi:protein phosphatase
MRDAISAAGLWDGLSTDWMILDCELMPWSAKAQELLTKQYAPVGSAATHATRAAAEILAQASSLTEGVDAILERVQSRSLAAEKYVDAYRRYCWPVSSINDLKLAPFHILATEGAVHSEKDHVWHMEMLGHICAEDPSLLLATPFKVVDTEDDGSVREGIAWWEELTGRGGEGMVIKPLSFVCEGARGLVQPAVKCRGREYLRIIYGPEYTLPENLSRLRKRGLGVKRSLALREFALGMEGLERFVRREPLRQVHECVFAVLAMESEPVDPRL